MDCQPDQERALPVVNYFSKWNKGLTTKSGCTSRFDNCFRNKERNIYFSGSRYISASVEIYILRQRDLYLFSQKYIFVFQTISSYSDTFKPESSFKWMRRFIRMKIYFLLNERARSYVWTGAFLRSKNSHKRMKSFA